MPPAAAVACSADAMVISAAGETLKFDKDKLTAKAGAQVKVCLKNVSTVNDHNWVLVKPGTKDAVATAGVTAGAGSDWIPASDNVLAKTKLIVKGQTGEVGFTVPAAGKYQYVCTFPGHNLTMFGEFEATP
jgi:azurin